MAAVLYLPNSDCNVENLGNVTNCIKRIEPPVTALIKRYRAYSLFFSSHMSEHTV